MSDPTWYELRDPKARPNDGKNLARFEWAAEKNENASAQQGRPVHERILRAVVVSPGMKNSETSILIERQRLDGTTKIYETHIENTPGLRDAYDQFRKNQAPELSGTPLETWPALDVARIADLKALHIHTLEQLAALSDAGLAKLGMGARELQKLARARLEEAKGGAPLEEAYRRIGELESELAALRNQMITKQPERQETVSV